MNTHEPQMTEPEVITYDGEELTAPAVFAVAQGGSLPV